MQIKKKRNEAWFEKGGAHSPKISLILFIPRILPNAQAANGFLSLVC